MNIESPCKQDCPNRSAYCRTECTKYKIYVALRNKEYERRNKQREQAALEYDYRARMRKRISY